MKATLRQQEIEMRAWSLILLWYIKVRKYLHCFFVVINENESALIIGSKLNPFFRDDEWYKLVS